MPVPNVLPKNPLLNLSHYNFGLKTAKKKTMNRSHIEMN